MRPTSFAQSYSSKTDEELLALVAERDFLVEEARAVLASEIERRNLTNPVQQAIVQSSPTPDSHLAPLTVRVKWVGMWLLNTLVATLGVAMTVGLLSTATRSLTTREMRVHLVQTPYYPVPILVGLVVGYFSYTRFKGSYRYWAWVGPAVLTLVSLMAWKAAHQSSLSQAAFHFFGFIPYPDNRDQRDMTMVLYMSMAYSVGAFIQTKVDGFVCMGK